jgi:hypothetical protein
MNEAPHTSGSDDQIRRALLEEAKGVEASDELLARTLAAAARPVARPARRFLAAAAVASVAVVAALTLIRDDGDEKVDAVDDPTTSTSEPNGDLTDLLAGVFPCEDTISTVMWIRPDAGRDEIDAIGAAAADVEGLAASIVTVPSDDVEARLLEQYDHEPASVALIEVSDIPSAVVVNSTDPDAEVRLRSEVSDLPGVETVVSTDCRQPGDGGGPADR